MAISKQAEGMELVTFGAAAEPDFEFAWLQCGVRRSRASLWGAGHRCSMPCMGLGLSGCRRGLSLNRLGGAAPLEQWTRVEQRGCHCDRVASYKYHTPYSKLS